MGYAKWKGQHQAGEKKYEYNVLQKRWVRTDLYKSRQKYERDQIAKKAAAEKEQKP